MEKTKNRNMATTESGCTAHLPILVLMMREIEVSVSPKISTIKPAYSFLPELKTICRLDLYDFFAESLAAAEKEEPLVRWCMDKYVEARKKSKAKKANQ